MGKEIEHQLTADEIALREVQGYIDKVERQSEIQQPQDQQPQPVQAPVQTYTQQGDASITGPAGGSVAVKITLPLDRAEVETGLKRSVIDAVRWLSEWCVMMIKKYPGRVFYMRPETNR